MNWFSFREQKKQSKPRNLDFIHISIKIPKEWLNKILPPFLAMSVAVPPAYLLGVSTPQILSPCPIIAPQSQEVPYEA